MGFPPKRCGPYKRRMTHAVAFIAKMIERIINAEVEGKELRSRCQPTLLHWCCFLKKMGACMRRVAIANTIVRVAKAYAL